MPRERLHHKLFLSYLLVTAVGLVGAAWIVGDGPAWRALLVAAGLSSVMALALSALVGARVGGVLDGLASSTRALGAGLFDGPDIPRGEGDDEVDAVGEALGQARRELAGRLGGLKDEAGKLRSVLEGMSEGVALVTDGRIAYANGAFSRVLDLTEHAEGRTPLEALRQTELADAIATAGTGAVARARDVTLPSGRVLHLRVEPLVGVGAVVVLLDVTVSRALERVRREFVANASHELRTPVAAIQAVAETLASNPSVGASDRARFERILYAHAQRLAHLVADLLDLSRAESGPRPRLQALDLREPIANAAIALRERAESRRVRIQQHLPATQLLVDGDPSSLEQVFVNLLDNAVRYVPEGGLVVLRAALVGEQVRVDVEDNGPGIAPEHLPRIFERFYRVDASRARDQGGTGLGLAIVKHLVRLHGGDVTVSSTTGRGTTFRVTLPTRGERPAAVAVED